VLRNTTLELYSPHNIPKHGEKNQRVRDGFYLEWSGGGTLKELTTRQSTQELGMADTRMATARSRAIPHDLRIVANSWKLRGPDGTWWEIGNRTRTGNLVTLSLSESEKQREHHR